MAPLSSLPLSSPCPPSDPPSAPLLSLAALRRPAASGGPAPDRGTTAGSRREGGKQQAGEQSTGTQGMKGAFHKRSPSLPPMPPSVAAALPSFELEAVASSTSASGSAVSTPAASPSLTHTRLRFLQRRKPSMDANADIKFGLGVGNLPVEGPGEVKLMSPPSAGVSASTGSLAPRMPVSLSHHSHAHSLSVCMGYVARDEASSTPSDHSPLGPSSGGHGRGRERRNSMMDLSSPTNHVLPQLQHVQVASKEHSQQQSPVGLPELSVVAPQQQQQPVMHKRTRSRLNRMSLGGLGPASLSALRSVPTTPLSASHLSVAEEGWEGEKAHTFTAPNNPTLPTWASSSRARQQVRRPSLNLSGVCRTQPPSPCMSPRAGLEEKLLSPPQRMGMLATDTEFTPHHRRQGSSRAQSPASHLSSTSISTSTPFLPPLSAGNSGVTSACPSLPGSLCASPAAPSSRRINFKASTFHTATEPHFHDLSPSHSFSSAQLGPLSSRGSPAFSSSMASVCSSPSESNPHWNLKQSRRSHTNMSPTNVANSSNNSTNNSPATVPMFYAIKSPPTSSAASSASIVPSPPHDRSSAPSAFSLLKSARPLTSLRATAAAAPSSSVNSSPNITPRIMTRSLVARTAQQQQQGAQDAPFVRTSLQASPRLEHLQRRLAPAAISVPSTDSSLLSSSGDSVGSGSPLSTPVSPKLSSCSSSVSPAASVGSTRALLEVLALKDTSPPPPFHPSPLTLDTSVHQGPDLHVLEEGVKPEGAEAAVEVEEAVLPPTPSMAAASIPSSSSVPTSARRGRFLPPPITLPVGFEDQISTPLTPTPVEQEEEREEGQQETDQPTQEEGPDQESLPLVEAFAPVLPFSVLLPSPHIELVDNPFDFVSDPAAPSSSLQVPSVGCSPHTATGPNSRPSRSPLFLTRRVREDDENMQGRLKEDVASALSHYGADESAQVAPLSTPTSATVTFSSSDPTVLPLLPVDFVLPAAPRASFSNYARADHGHLLEEEGALGSPVIAPSPEPASPRARPQSAKWLSIQLGGGGGGEEEAAQSEEYAYGGGQGFEEEDFDPEEFEQEDDAADFWEKMDSGAMALF